MSSKCLSNSRCHNVTSVPKPYRAHCSTLTGQFKLHHLLYYLLFLSAQDLYNQCIHSVINHLLPVCRNLVQKHTLLRSILGQYLGFEMIDVSFSRLSWCDALI